nr:MAG TPA: hypothetical protein [Caudoviricetes sp.]
MSKKYFSFLRCKTLHITLHCYIFAARNIYDCKGIIIIRSEQINGIAKNT